MYKWGLINKKAGSVSLVTRPHSTKNDFQAVLTAATAPWADNIFMLRDTLMGTINSSNFLPIYYEKIAKILQLHYFLIVREKMVGRYLLK